MNRLARVDKSLYGWTAIVDVGGRDEQDVPGSVPRLTPGEEGHKQINFEAKLTGSGRTPGDRN